MRVRVAALNALLVSVSKIDYSGSVLVQKPLLTFGLLYVVVCVCIIGV